MDVKITTLKDMALGGETLEFTIEIAGPSPMMPVEELEESLQTNRQLLDEYHLNLVDMMRNDYLKTTPPWDLPYHSLLKNAVMARLNIDKLIPAINAKGGRAQFSQLETKSAGLHVEILMKNAEKTVLSETVGSIPMSTIVILTFLVACAALGYLYLTNTNF